MTDKPIPQPSVLEELAHALREGKPRFSTRRQLEVLPWQVGCYTRDGYPGRGFQSVAAFMTRGQALQYSELLNNLDLLRTIFTHFRDKVQNGECLNHIARVDCAEFAFFLDSILKESSSFPDIDMFLTTLYIPRRGESSASLRGTLVSTE